MRDLYAFAFTPAGIWLLRWSSLLAIAWLANLAFSRGHPRWRLIIWRTTVVVGLMLPFASLRLTSALNVRVRTPRPSITGDLSLDPATLLASPPVETAADSAPSASRSSLASALQREPAVAHRRLLSDLSWRRLLLTIWVIGGLGAAIRLVWIHLRLARLRHDARPAEPALVTLAGAIQRQLGWHGRPPALRISPTIHSPFVCGVANPSLLLPEKLLPTLTHKELSVLLAHEFAHLRSHDLVWCVAWRWMQAAVWFHPLVWKAPAAHNFACEEHADRIASGLSSGQAAYAQSLAHLSLNVAALSSVETALTLNASAQIARRMKRLLSGPLAAWTWRHSLAGVGLVAALGFVALGWGVQKAAADSATPGPQRAPQEFRTAVVTVVDERGQPVSGATLIARGFRVSGSLRGDGYEGWDPQNLGKAPVLTTDQSGHATVRFPVMATIVDEKIALSAIEFAVMHAGFWGGVAEFLVDGTALPLHLMRVSPLTLSGYTEPGHRLVDDFFLNLDFHAGANTGRPAKPRSPWQTWLPLGDNLLMLMAQLPSGQILYSDSTPLHVEEGTSYRLDLELKPGIRLEGRIDRRVPRPIRNAHVVVYFVPPQLVGLRDVAEQRALSEKSGYSYVRPRRRAVSPITPDGSFVFESIPAGAVDVVALGDGFASTGGATEDPNSQIGDPNGFGIPQRFVLMRPTTRIEVATQRTSSLVVTVRDKDGQPVSGVKVDVNPKMLVGSGTTFFGKYGVQGPDLFAFFDGGEDSIPPFSAVTDNAGVATISDLPPMRTGLILHSDWYEIPPKYDGLPSRTFQVSLLPGQVTRSDVTVEPNAAQKQLSSSVGKLRL